MLRCWRTKTVADLVEDGMTSQPIIIYWQVIVWVSKATERRNFKLQLLIKTSFVSFRSSVSDACINTNLWCIKELLMILLDYLFYVKLMFNDLETLWLFISFKFKKEAHIAKKRTKFTNVTITVLLNNYKGSTMSIKYKNVYVR